MLYSIDHLYIHKNTLFWLKNSLDNFTVKLVCSSCSQLLKSPLITHLPKEKVLLFQSQIFFETWKQENYSAFKI